MTTPSMSLNVGNFVTLKLSQTNYLLWREQILGLAESQELVDHLTDVPPEKTTATETTTTEAVQKYTSWQKSDRLLRGWIIGTLSEESLGLVIGLDTAYAVWEALKESYAQDSQEREFTLRQHLTYLRKEDNTSIADHIRKFKGICDSLAAIGKPVPEKERVYCLLTSLGPHYESFATTMLKPPRPSYIDLISQLQNHDKRRSWFTTSNDQFASHTPHLAFYSQRQRRVSSPNSTSKFTSAGRGFQAQQSQPQRQNFTGQRRAAPPGQRRMTAIEREAHDHKI